jgi:protein-S-isoprenylcysteine O-methyltransferase Ste14
MSSLVHATLQTPKESGVQRYRKPAGRLAAALFLVALFFTESPVSFPGALAMETVGLFFVIFAALGRIWCAIYIAGRKNQELCTDGPYSLCRNPLYGFSFLGVVGVALTARLLPVAIMAGLVFWLYHHQVILAEEEKLRCLFGERFDDYCSRVPRIWPRLHGFASRTAITLDPRLLVRAMTEVVWFLLALVLIEYVEHLRAASFLPTLVLWRY